MVWGAAIGAGASLIGTAVSALGASRANSANKKLYREQRDDARQDYARRYQITMTDMRRAGLNPMLAYQQGAPVPSRASAAPMRNVLEGADEGGSRAATTALAYKRQKAEQAVMESNAYKATEEGRLAGAREENEVQQWRLMKQQEAINESDLASAAALEEYFKKYPAMRWLGQFGRDAGWMAGVGGAAAGAYALYKQKKARGHPRVQQRELPNPNYSGKGGLYDQLRQNRDRLQSRGKRKRK